MTTETDERMELVEPDQYSGSPASGGSAEGSMADSLSGTPLREREQPERVVERDTVTGGRSFPSGEETGLDPAQDQIQDPLAMINIQDPVQDSLPILNHEETGLDPVKEPDPLQVPTPEETRLHPGKDSLQVPDPKETGLDPGKEPDPLQVPNPKDTGLDPAQKPDPLQVPIPKETGPDPLPVPTGHLIPGGRHRGPEPDNVRYRKGCDGEYEACYRLRQDGWIVSRWQGYPSPPDLIAVRSDEILLVMVRRSGQPVPDAHAVVLRYRDGLACLRDIGSPAVVRKEAWIFCPPDGCHCYEVLPGGIRRIRREWEKKGIVPETPFAEVPFPRNGGEETAFKEVPFPRTTRKTGEETPSTEVPFPRTIPKSGEETPSTEVPFLRTIPKSGEETPSAEVPFLPPPKPARGEVG